jgi:para-aminobenzoate synthetase component 2
VVDEASLSAELLVTSRTEDGVIMALTHRRWPVVGVQFHPESILTEGGYELLANFLRQAGLEPASSIPTMNDERRSLISLERALPTRPVTF